MKPEFAIVLSNEFVNALVAVPEALLAQLLSYFQECERVGTRIVLASSPKSKYNASELRQLLANPIVKLDENQEREKEKVADVYNNQPAWLQFFCAQPLLCLPFARFGVSELEHLFPFTARPYFLNLNEFRTHFRDHTFIATNVPHPQRVIIVDRYLKKEDVRSVLINLCPSLNQLTCLDLVVSNSNTNLDKDEIKGMIEVCTQQAGIILNIISVPDQASHDRYVVLDNLFLKYGNSFSNLSKSKATPSELSVAFCVQQSSLIQHYLTPLYTTRPVPAVKLS